jgi:hypothetical protein
MNNMKNYKNKMLVRSRTLTAKDVENILQQVYTRNMSKETKERLERMKTLTIEEYEELLNGKKVEEGSDEALAQKVFSRNFKNAEKS